MWQREAAEAERRSEESRRRLVAGMSHDLRSPLAGICGWPTRWPTGWCATRRGPRLPRPDPPRGVPDDRDGRGPLPALPGHVRHAQLTWSRWRWPIASDAVAARRTPTSPWSRRRPRRGRRCWAATPTSPGCSQVLANAVRHTDPGGAVRLSGTRGGERGCTSTTAAAASPRRTCRSCSTSATAAAARAHRPNTVGRGSGCRSRAA